MKRYFGWITTILLLFTISSISFSEVIKEGVLKGYLETSQMTNNLSIFIKGLKAKVSPERQISETNGYPIIDFSAKKVTFVVVDKKYYFEMPIDGLMANVEKDPVDLGDPVSVEDFNGEKMKKYRKNIGEYTVELLATDKYLLPANFFLGFQRIGEEGLLMVKSINYILSRGEMPMKITVTKGKEKLIYLEVKSLQFGKVDDSFFEIPKGYKSLSQYLQDKKGIKR